MYYKPNLIALMYSTIHINLSEQTAVWKNIIALRKIHLLIAGYVSVFEINMHYTQGGLLWTASYSGDFQSVKKYLTKKNINANWKNPQMHVSMGVL